MRIELSKIAVVIVNYRTASQTVALLKSLRRVRGGGERMICVVDSRSDDGSGELIRSALNGNEHYVQAEENLGYGACNNIGIRKGLEWGADYFLILNPDVTVEEDFLSRLLIALEAQKKTGIACPVALVPDGETIQSVGGEYSLYTGRALRRHIGRNAGFLKGDFEYVDFPQGDAILFKKEFFEDAGLFHEKFFLYYEDVEIGLRAREEYWRTVVIHQSRVCHRDTTRERLYDPLINFTAARNQIWVERLHASLLQLAVFALVSVFLRYPFRIARAVITLHFRAAFMTVKGVFAGAFGKGLYGNNHFNMPLRTKKAPDDDTVPDLPSIVFRNSSKSGSKR